MIPVAVRGGEYAALQSVAPGLLSCWGTERAGRDVVDDLHRIPSGGAFSAGVRGLKGHFWLSFL